MKMNHDRRWASFSLLNIIMQGDNMDESVVDVEVETWEKKNIGLSMWETKEKNIRRRDYFSKQRKVHTSS